MPLRLFAVSAVFALSSSLSAATFVVDNVNDSGLGSLRQAILSANESDGNTVSFAISGTITLSSPLPALSRRVIIDGTTAPGFAQPKPSPEPPVVAVDFNGNTGLMVGSGAEDSSIRSLSFVGASNAGITLAASRITIHGCYIGLLPNGTVNANAGDGIRVLATSAGNVIGNFNPVSGVTYGDTSNAADFTVQPVSAWRGIRNYAADPDAFLICGSADDNGLLYVGPLFGGGTSYLANFPGASTESTSVYGPDNLEGDRLRLVGSYKRNNSTEFNFGFIWEGTLAQLPSGGTWREIAYPGATYQYTHSTMGKLAVGNADGPAGDLPIGPGIAYIYDVDTEQFVDTIEFPGSKSNTAYGIWKNSEVSYTICGGFSPLVTNNLQTPGIPLEQGKAFLVDYNPETKEFSNWTAFDYPNGPVGVDFITHFEGISSQEPGVYTLNADSVEAGTTNPAQGSWVNVVRNADTTLSQQDWVDLNYTDNNVVAAGVTSSNSVYGNQVVGLVINDASFSYQASVNVEFQLSNVISGNGGNGITLDGASDNVIAMNFIGTDAAGSAAEGFGNAGQGIYVTRGASGNLIGGPSGGINNPTGSKNPANAVFQRPPQGNLISRNGLNGVLIDENSSNNVLSGNFIGTDESGLTAAGNVVDGVVIRNAPQNSLIGCTLFENPFVAYNVVSGNGGNGVRVESSDNVTIQANFLGMGADNATSVPNGLNGLVVAGSSANTQVGGVIPLGNVIAGNTGHGIEVRDTVSGFISFNTFTGIAAFQEFASPNGLNGILITATGGNITVQTCIISGNAAHGIEIGGNASGVQITDTAAGTNTEIAGAIPNQGSGIVISGTAHNNAIGGYQPSVERAVHMSGNVGYGIAIIDNAFDNFIYGSFVGLGAGLNPQAIPNGFGGILLGAGTRGTKIGGHEAAFQNTIQGNTGAGLDIESSTDNEIVKNLITLNTAVGLFATGVCDRTFVTDNTIVNNGPGGTNNINIANATGITYGEVDAFGPPQIKTQPVSQTGRVGNSVSLTVLAAGNPELSYQWQRDGTDLPGATDRTLTLDDLQTGNAGDYTVRVTNGFGSVSSAPATVSVLREGSLAAWLLDYFSSSELEDSLVSSLAADPDHDGLSNLIEYALGTDPRSVTTAPSTVTATEQYWIFTYLRPADRTDVSYVVEASTDLTSWGTNTVVHERKSEGVMETWEARLPRGATKAFLRLSVSVSVDSP